MLIFLSLILFVSIPLQQLKYVKTKVNDDITLMLPEEFTLLTQAELNRKYVSSKAPVAVYSDFSKEVDLGVNVAFSRWNQEDLAIMKSFYKSNIMGLYDEVQFLQEEIQEIDGKQFVIFEFLSTVRDTEGTTINQSPISKYVRIHYTIVNYKTVLFNFSCPARVKEKWAPIAQSILESAKISKTL